MKREILTDEIIIKMSNDCYMLLQWGSEPCCENCDGCIDFTIFDSHKKEIDGGQLDFGPIDKYKVITDAIDDVLEFAYLDNIVPTYIITNLTYNDGFEGV